MAEVLLAFGRNSAVGPASTLYGSPYNGRTDWASSESSRQVPMRTAGTFRRLYIRVPTNASTGTSTVRFRKNGANGNQSVSIGAAATGEFEDITNSDAVVAGDLVAVQLVSGAGGGLTPTTHRILFAADVGTVEPCGCGGGTSSVAAGDYYGALGGLGTQTAIAQAQTKMRNAATFSALAEVVASNNWTGTQTEALNVNGVDSALTISIPASTSGTFEDTTHTVDVAVGDLVCFHITVAAGSGTVTGLQLRKVAQQASGGYRTTAGATGATGGASFAASLTRYLMLGAFSAQSAEANAQTKVGVAVTLSSLMLYVGANTLTGSSTLTLRKNAANATGTLSIGAGATGLFEDTTHADTFGPTDQVSAQLVTGAGTAMTVSVFGVSYLWSPATVTGAQATETDTANAGTPRATATGQQATESDVGNSGAARALAAGAQATETDTAAAGTAATAAAGQQAVETDTANGGAPVARVPGAQALEVDTAAAGTPSARVLGQQALETDEAHAGSGGNTVAGSQAAETDIAQPGTASALAAGGKATETDAAAAGVVLVRLAGGLALEVDAANPGSALAIWIGSQAQETDIAFPGLAIAGALAADRLGCDPEGSPADRRAGIAAGPANDRLAGTAAGVPSNRLTGG